MRRLVLTTDWSTIKRRIREKKKFFWLVPDSFYEKNSIKRIWRWYPVHKYCVYWTILQSYTLISYVNTCNISNNIEEEVEKIVFGRLPLFSFFFLSHSIVFICLYDVISPTMMGLCLFHTWASGGVRRRRPRSRFIHMHINIRAVAVAWSCLDRRFSFASLHLPLFLSSLNSVHKYDVTSYNKQRLWFSGPQREISSNRR